MLTNPLENDLNHILKYTLPLWEELRDQRIFITGGTGFFGCWLLESFMWANLKLNLNASAVVLTRNISSFSKKYPHLMGHSALHFHEGDVRSFDFPNGKYSHIIHAATEASAQLNESHPLLMLDTIIAGTKHTLEFARYCKTKRFLFTSSGAVYGKQPPEIKHLTENYPCQLTLNDAKSAYAIGKYTAEHMSCLYAQQHELDVKIARCFAFVGPYLPLDIHYAIGNFIRDGLNGGPILVNGDGTPYRSYLYAADLAIWLWTILFRGLTARPYNIGSNEAITIADLAYLVTSCFEPSLQVRIMKTPSTDKLPERYVPDITRARNELGLIPQISLVNGIHATKQWYLTL